MEELPFFERIRAARPGFAELTEDETDQLAAYLQHLPRTRISLSKQQRERKAGVDTYQRELDTEHGWRAHLRAVRDYNQRRIGRAITSAVPASVTPAGVRAIADRDSTAAGPHMPDTGGRVPDSDRERYGELRRELERSAVRLEEDPDILFGKKPDYSGGLNSEALNRLAGEPIIIIETVPPSAETSGEKYVIVSGPDGEDPVRWRTWDGSLGHEGHNLKKLERTVRHLRAWRDWAAGKERQAAKPNVASRLADGLPERLKDPPGPECDGYHAEECALAEPVTPPPSDETLRLVEERFLGNWDDLSRYQWALPLIGDYDAVRPDGPAIPRNVLRWCIYRLHQRGIVRAAVYTRDPTGGPWVRAIGPPSGEPMRTVPIDDALLWVDAEACRRARTAPHGKGDRRKGTRKRGRPIDTDQNTDKRYYEAWKTGKYKTVEELAARFGESERKVKLGMDRHRKRLEREKGDHARRGGNNPCQEG